MKIGTYLKQQRVSKGIFIAQVAEKMELTIKAIYRIEAATDLNTKTIRKYFKSIKL